MSDALTLSDVLARGVALEWHEAVAVVRGVAEALLANPENVRLLPELHQIQISPTGRVDVIGGTVVQEPVRRLGQLLQATLGQSEPPVQLRLLISQATAPIPAYASIAEYDEALGYFERPGRSLVLQVFHTRASQASVASRIGGVPTLDTIAPLPAADGPTTDRTKPAAKPRARAGRLVTAGAVVVVLGVAGVQYVRVKGARSDGSLNLSAMAARGLNRAGTASVKGLSFVTERVGLGRLVSADSAAADQKEDVARPAGKAPKAATARRVLPEAQHLDGARIVAVHGTTSAGARARAVSAANTFEITDPPIGLPSRNAPFVAFDLEPGNDTGASSRNALVKQPAMPNRPPDEEHAAEDGPTIFTVLSEGVSSPVGLRPQLPRTLPSDVHRSDLRLIELVIAPDGRVESVKLVGVPRDVHDSMLLSAAKAWEFEPARKNGVPVRYRKTVWVAPRS